MKVCIVGASGKLGRYMVQHALDRGYEVVGVSRERSVSKLERSKGASPSFPERRMTARSYLFEAQGLHVAFWAAADAHR